MIEQDEGLQHLLLDEEVTITLRRRDWITIATLWTAFAGEANYKQAIASLSNMYTYEKPPFTPCMRSPRHLHMNCQEERVRSNEALYPFIGLNSED